jgi:prolyl-tRNA synthetase
MSPYGVHLIELPGAKGAKELYEKLQQNKVEVLFDDREVGAGEKFADADLIGIPVRLLVSGKTKDKIEWKDRTKDTSDLITLEQTIKRAD